jgi:hypothetical protein
MRIRREIVTETYRTILMTGRAGLTAWCEVCRMQSRLLTPEQAAIVTHDSARSIYRLIETACAEQTEEARREQPPGPAIARPGEGAYVWIVTDGLHFFETADGLVFVCLNSLG